MVWDADSKVDEEMLERYRAMTMAEKWTLVAALNEKARQEAVVQLKEKYGEMSEQELKLRIASLTIDRATMIRVFGWDPDAHGR